MQRVRYRDLFQELREALGDRRSAEYKRLLGSFDSIGSAHSLEAVRFLLSGDSPPRLDTGALVGRCEKRRPWMRRPVRRCSEDKTDEAPPVRRPLRKPPPPPLGSAVGDPAAGRPAVVELRRRGAASHFDDAAGLSTTATTKRLASPPRRREEGSLRSNVESPRRPREVRATTSGAVAERLALGGTFDAVRTAYDELFAPTRDRRGADSRLGHNFAVAAVADHLHLGALQHDASGQVATDELFKPTKDRRPPGPPHTRNAAPMRP